jgi:tetratricopeptide (TPR) repeat protein
MKMKVITTMLLAAGLMALGSCSTPDSRIVHKPFEDLKWIERTRSPVALAMSERHFRFTRYYKRAYDDAGDAFDTAKKAIESGGENDIGVLFELQKLYEGYRKDLIANLKAVLFFKPDHRPALYELISLLEEKWYSESDGTDPLNEFANLKELEGALRQTSDFFGRDYEVNYKLGAVIYKEGVIIGDLQAAGLLQDEPPPLQRFKDAQVFLRKCVAVRSTYAEAYELLALCLEREGRDKEAYKFWKLITVIEQAQSRQAPGEITPELREVFDTAKNRVAEFGKMYGDTN